MIGALATIGNALPFILVANLARLAHRTCAVRHGSTDVSGALGLRTGGRVARRCPDVFGDGPQRRRRLHGRLQLGSTTGRNARLACDCGRLSAAHWQHCEYAPASRRSSDPRSRRSAARRHGLDRTSAPARRMPDHGARGLRTPRAARGVRAGQAALVTALSALERRRFLDPRGSWRRMAGPGTMASGLRHCGLSAFAECPAFLCLRNSATLGYPMQLELSPWPRLRCRRWTPPASCCSED